MLREYSKYNKMVYKYHFLLFITRYTPKLFLVNAFVILFMSIFLIFTTDTCYCSPPENVTLQSMMRQYPDDYAIQFVNWYVERDLPTNHLSLAAQILINFKLTLSQENTLTILAMNNAFEVYHTLLS